MREKNRISCCLEEAGFACPGVSHLLKQELKPYHLHGPVGQVLVCVRSSLNFLFSETLPKISLDYAYASSSYLGVNLPMTAVPGKKYSRS